MIAPDRKQQRRIVELMVLTALADGTVEGSEALTIRELVQRHPALAGVGETAAISNAIRERSADIGLEACVREVAAGITDAAQRAVAFRCCVLVTSADSHVAGEEALVLALLQEALELTTDQVRRLIAEGDE